MKVKVKEIESNFIPIILEVRIDSEKELCDLWLRHNIASWAVDEAQDVNYFNHKADSDVTSDLSETLTELCKQRELFLNGINV